jgi:hypothetical protein
MRRPTYGAAVSTLALFIALGGPRSCGSSSILTYVFE